MLCADLEDGEERLLRYLDAARLLPPPLSPPLRSDPGWLLLEQFRDRLLPPHLRPRKKLCGHQIVGGKFMNRIDPGAESLLRKVRRMLADLMQNSSHVDQT
jgi:hypothetical protein